jgi:hypothetical protein
MNQPLLTSPPCLFSLILLWVGTLEDSGSQLFGVILTTDRMPDCLTVRK